MRRTGMWLSVLAMAMFAGSASAGHVITTDGDWSDWFSYGGTGSNNWDQAAAAGSTLNANIRSLADEEGPTPGGGGQLYDIEQIFYYYEDAGAGLTGGTLYVGLITGFPPAGVDADLYYAGDLFLGLGGSGDLNIAVGVAEANVLDANNDARFGRAFFGDPVHWVDPDPFGSSTPWRMDLDDLPGGVDGGVGEGLLTEVTGTLNPSVAWGGANNPGVRNFLEVAIELDGAGEEAITDPTSGGLSLQWTMGCGNDVITVNDNVPLAPIPEPTTMVLLGMGVLGMALRARRPVC